MKTSIKISASLLFLFILLVVGCSKKETETTKNPLSDKHLNTKPIKHQGSPDKLVVYYFHTNYRCNTCNKFESLTKDVLEQDFKNFGETGKIEYKLINIENEPNKHYVDEYKIVTKSLILSLEKKKIELQWKNLDKIWELVSDDDRFKNYIHKEIKMFLNQVS
jgi:hypothetical protein